MTKEEKDEGLEQPDKEDTVEEEPVEVTEGQINDNPEPTPEPDLTPMPEIVSEEPCDPATMDCGQMRDVILDLTSERTKYVESIKKLDDVKQVMPSDELTKAHDDAVAKKEAIDDKIYGTFEQFMVCANAPEPVAKPEPEPEPELKKEEPKTTE